MWLYYLKLAFLSIRKTPILSSMMVLATAVGIGACLTIVTAFAVIASNPMTDKNDIAFSIQLDAWDPEGDGYARFNGLPPQLTYRDAVALSETGIQDKTVIMTKSFLPVQDIESEIIPSVEPTRITSSDFFSLFDVDFIYGGPWDETVDLVTRKVAVINEKVNLAIFNGTNSVGEAIQIDGQSYIVVGVVADDWAQIPNVYDLNNGPFSESAAIYIPFSLLENNAYTRGGNTSSWDATRALTYSDFLQSDTIWIQAWVELSSEAQKNEFEGFIENYISQQKEVGRFQRPMKYLLSTPEQWLKINEVVSSDNLFLLNLSIVFLFVCVVNTIVMLLAKFLRKAPESGIRRALGASRQAIFSQHIFEALVIGILGGIFGLGFSWLGLAGIRELFGEDLENIAVFSSFTVIMALVFALAASLLSGILPAWKISHTQPASYLKTQ